MSETVVVVPISVLHMSDLFGATLHDVVERLWAVTRDLSSQHEDNPTIQMSLWTGAGPREKI